MAGYRISNHKVMNSLPAISKSRSSLRCRYTKWEMGSAASIFRLVSGSRNVICKRAHIRKFNGSVLQPVHAFAPLSNCSQYLGSLSVWLTEHLLLCPIFLSKSHPQIYGLLLHILSPLTYYLQHAVPPFFAENSGRTFLVYGPVWQHCWSTWALRRILAWRADTDPRVYQKLLVYVKIASLSRPYPFFWKWQVKRHCMTLPNLLSMRICE